jgi:hypothetical protein
VRQAWSTLVVYKTAAHLTAPEVLALLALRQARGDGPPLAARGLVLFGVDAEAVRVGACDLDLVRRRPAVRAVLAGQGQDAAALRVHDDGVEYGAVDLVA